MSAFILVAFLTYPVLAEDILPTEPLLQLNTDRHTAPIYRIATDAQNRFVVTASADKTARVWSLPDGQLQTILRVPIGDGKIERLAVAITPDGSTFAVGGWTAPEGQTENIYLFDRISGALKQRLSGLPIVVVHLAYSKDGRISQPLWPKKMASVFLMWRAATRPCPAIRTTVIAQTGPISMHEPAGHNLVRWLRAPICGGALRQTDGSEGAAPKG
jgi:hypothetical protein